VKSKKRPLFSDSTEIETTEGSMVLTSADMEGRDDSVATDGEALPDVGAGAAAWTGSSSPLGMTGSPKDES
jgi:hypothetical protein